MRLGQREARPADDVLLADAVLLRAVAAHQDLHLLQRRVAALAAEQPPGLLHRSEHSPLLHSVMNSMLKMPPSPHTALAEPAAVLV